MGENHSLNLASRKSVKDKQKYFLSNDQTTEKHIFKIPLNFELYIVPIFGLLAAECFKIENENSKIIAKNI